MNFYYDSKIFVVYLAMFLAIFTISSSLLKIFEIININSSESKITKIITLPSYMMANLLSHIGNRIFVSMEFW